MMSSLLKVEEIFQKKNQEDPSIRPLVLRYFHFSFFFNLIVDNLLTLDILDICQRTAFHYYIKSKYIENFVVFFI